MAPRIGALGALLCSTLVILTSSLPTTHKTRMLRARRRLQGAHGPPNIQRPCSDFPLARTSIAAAVMPFHAEP